jgi:hypothetical protein
MPESWNVEVSVDWLYIRDRDNEERMIIFVSEILEDRFSETEEESWGVCYSTVCLLSQKIGVYWKCIEIKAFRN